MPHYSKRIQFPVGEQRAFITAAKNALVISPASMARPLNISHRTLADWQREKFSMSEDALKLLIEHTSITRPSAIKVRDPFWYSSEGAKIGGKVTYERHRWSHIDETNRIRRWQEWWEREGKYEVSKRMKGKNFVTRHTIKQPRFSPQLAEFTGIMLGDGGISRFQAVVTLNSVTDADYARFVTALIHDLFGVSVGYKQHKDAKAVDLVVSRVALVDYCVETLGLVRGDKVRQQVDIPGWIKNRHDYGIACMRGLFDTDGSVFTHSYKVKGKVYAYKKWSYTSASRPLLESAQEILTSCGIKSRLTNEIALRIAGRADVARYFKIIGTSNQKHLKRYRN